MSSGVEIEKTQSHPHLYPTHPQFHHSHHQDPDLRSKVCTVQYIKKFDLGEDSLNHYQQEDMIQYQSGHKGHYDPKIRVLFTLFCTILVRFYSTTKTHIKRLYLLMEKCTRMMWYSKRATMM